MDDEIYINYSNVALRLVEVATVRNGSIVFLTGGKQSIWQGKNYEMAGIVYTLWSKVTFYIFNYFTGYTPIDGIPKKEIVSISLTVTTLFAILYIGGTAFALLCLIFNIANRKKK